MSQLSQLVKIVGCLAPVDSGGAAKAGAGVSMAKYNHVTFLVYIGNIANDQTLTVEECSDSAGTNNVAITIKGYRKATTGAAAKSVLDGALTAFTNAGITLANAADDNKIYALEVDASNLSTPATKTFVRPYLTAGAVALDCVIAILSEPRYLKDVPPDPTV
jgi:hypothetical protein